MITKLQVLASDGDYIGEIDPSVESFDVMVYNETVVISHRKGEGLDFKRGDFRCEIEGKEAIVMCKTILFALKLNENELR